MIPIQNGLLMEAYCAFLKLDEDEEVFISKNAHFTFKAIFHKSFGRMQR